MSKSYTKKPITIEAIQLKRNDTENNTDNVLEFCQEEAFLREGEIYIKTLEGEMRVSADDYVIKGIKGEFYPCKPDIFEASYNVGHLDSPCEETFEDRLINEERELDFKLRKLEAFINNHDEFEKIDLVQQHLLKIQSSTMACYRDLLKIRLERLNEK